MNAEELETIINRYLDGAATDREIEALSAEMETSGDARARYLRLARMHARLATFADADLEEETSVVREASNTVRNSYSWLAWAAALAILLGAGAIWTQRTPRTEVELATLNRMVGVQVAEGAGTLRVGQKLSAGRLALSGGTMLMTLVNGVTILFEGPGELELLTPMRALLHSGQAVVRVPQNAIGFQLETPAASIEDLGTEFAAKVGPGLSTDIQVYEGVVVTTLKPSGGAGGFPQRLAAGKAVRFTPNESAAGQAIGYHPERFVRQLPPDKPIEIEENDSPLFNPTQVEEMLVLPPERPIVVDGDLSEWSDAGLFRAERQPGGSAGQFVEGRMRYDARFLYIAAHIGDRAPMRNVIDPAIDGEFGWRGGGLQVRLSTDPALGWPVDANAPVYYTFRRLEPDAAHLANATSNHLAHLTMWHHAPSGKNCLHLDYGMDFHGGIVNPPGYRASFKKDADGRGYTLEYAIPWSLLGAGKSPPRAGDTLAVSWTTHWSDEGGRLWRSQLVEVRNASEPLRIHTWERAATWGRAIYR